jgi:WD40 repeat protein
MPLHQKHPQLMAMAFSSDSTFLATAGWDGVVRLWDYKNRRLYRSTRIPIAMHSLAFSPDSKRLAVGFVNGTVGILDVAGEQKTLMFRVVKRLVDRPGAPENFVRQVAFLEAGKILLTYAGGSYRLWDTATGESRDDLMIDQKAGDIIVAEDGETLVCVGEEYSMLWHLPTGRQRRQKMSWLPEIVISPSALSSDQSTLACTTPDRKILLYDVATGRIRQQMVAGTSQVGAATFSPDGKTLASNGDTVMLWNVATGQELLSLVSPEGSFTLMAFSPDGRTLATSHSTGAIYLWMTANEPPKTATTQ